MHEIVIHPISGTKDRTIHIDKTTPIIGGIEHKDFVECLMQHGDRFRNIRLVRRKYPVLGTFINQSPELYITQWKRFRQAGLPVVPTLRYDDENRLYLTHMTATGGVLFGKNFLKLFESGYYINLNQIVMPHFNRIVGENIHQQPIKRKVMQMASSASNAGIGLPSDDPFELLVLPDGTWQLVILDLRFASYVEKSTAQNNELSALTNANYRYAMDFLGILQEINYKCK